ncbi:hypothetical protein SAMN05428987_0010 [Paenibacillus sp. CF095]|nr:hypothetical protein SAMN05428987_0010 [Paenibacillus sp. CF095]
MSISQLGNGSFRKEVDYKEKILDGRCVSTIIYSVISIYKSLILTHRRNAHCADGRLAIYDRKRAYP